ncbi:MAG: hypothetical protein O2897_05435 [bacterium]|nr:hypothetical protein [bacterium]
MPQAKHLGIHSLTKACPAALFASGAALMFAGRSMNVNAQLIPHIRAGVIWLEGSDEVVLSLLHDTVKIKVANNITVLSMFSPLIVTIVISLN